jgi:mono/diheme cytochrome c family protein
MNRKLLACGLIGAALAAFAACGGDDDQEEPVDCSNNTLTYKDFGKPLIDGKCVTCHSPQLAASNGGVDLSTLDEVKHWQEHVIEHAVEREEPAMPYNMPALPEADRKSLKQWLECGADP